MRPYLKQQRGVSFVECIAVALVVGLLLVIILKNYADAVRAERRSLAHQGMFTVVGLQERWFVRMYEYAERIEQVGGPDIAGEHYKFSLTQDPCGNRSCFTVIASFKTGDNEDPECERMSISSSGIRKAYNRDNEDTTEVCWKLG
jgi:Tfp pilus assembly protein PilE